MPETDESTPQKALGFLKRLVGGQLDRVDGWMDRAEEMQARNIDGATEAIDEMADLSKETLNYANNLSREWVEWNLETVRSITGTNEEK